MWKHWGWVVLLVATSGCDDKGEKKKDVEPSATATQSATASAPAPSAAPEPEPPKVENAVTFKSKRVNMDGFTLTHTEATKRKMSTGAKSYVSIIIDFSNYDRGGGDYLPNPSKDEHRRITLNFASPSDPSPGTYQVGGVLGQGNKVNVGIHTRDHHIGLINTGTGSGEITSIDDKTVSGTVKVHDEHGTSVEASFSVPYETK